MLLAGTNQQRLALEDRVLLANTKRDALLETARILGSTRDISELFSAIMVHAKTLMEVERTTMFLVDHTRKVLYTADGLADGREITVPWDKGLAGACYQSKQVVNIRDAYTDDRFNKNVDLYTGFRTVSVLCYPVLNKDDEVIGVIQLINKISGLPQFTDQDVDLMVAFSAQIGMCIEHVQSAKALRNELHKLDRLVDAISGLTRTMSKFDRYSP